MTTQYGLVRAVTALADALGWRVTLADTTTERRVVLTLTRRTTTRRTDDATTHTTNGAR